MKTILVTGGCGFIGSNFVRLLAAQGGYRVINLDKLTYAGNLENVADVAGAHYRFVKGDICDRLLIDRLLEEEGPWAIVNFAAESHVDRSILDASPFMNANIAGVQVLLEAIRRHSVERFLHVSTDEVYGDKVGKQPSSEESPLLPSSPYAATKAAADLLCFSYRRTYGLPVIVTRSSNNYGPYQFPEKLIPLLIRNALNDLDFPVYGDGRQIRDWLYVEDNCRAILGVLEKGQIGSIYNIGTGEERTNLDVVESICAAIAERNARDLQKLKKRIRYVIDRPGHDRRYAIDTSRVRIEIGWNPRETFVTRLKHTVDWYLDHQEWIARVTSGEYQKYYDSVYAQAWGRTGA
ncbi:MAG: dTDP-glucose 4,6-dehydratase [Candidatus Binatia bacterium]